TVTREVSDPVEPSVFVLPGPKPVPAPAPAPPVSVAREVQPETFFDPPPVLRRTERQLPEDLQKDPAIYLQRRLGAWTEDDAKKTLGEPIRQRLSFDAGKNLDGQILTFDDPSRKYRDLELDFDKDTGFLRSVFVYPWKLKWDECRKMWGTKV